MHKIVTLTFSPCIDKSTTVSSLIPDIKMRCSLPKLEPGGGGVNVARAIKKLGGDATALFFSGGYTGQHFNELMERENIHSVIIETANETRENITVVDELANKQYRLGMPLPALSLHEWKQFIIALEALEDIEYIIASGSLPPETPSNIFEELATVAKKKNAKLVVDTSSEHLQQALEAGVFLIKPNLGELSLLANKKQLSPDEAKDIAQTIIAEGKCKVVVISMGAEGAMLVSSEVYAHIKPPYVKRKSTVGAGDSMVAGIIFNLSQGKNLLEAVQYGVACGTAATLNSGTELCRKIDADNLFLQIQSSK